MTPTPASDWLLDALRSKPQNRPAEDVEQFVDEVWRLATENGVLPLLHFKLKDTPAWVRLPDSLRQKLTASNRNAVAAEMLQEEIVTEVVDKLESIDIHPLIIKGTALAYTLYAQPQLRSRCDTDLLFADREVAEKAWVALKQLGYQRPATVSGDFVSHQFSCYKTGPMGMTHALDIHWRISNRPAIARAFPYQELAGRAATVNSLSHLAKTLDPADALLLACAHRIAHKPEGMENRLIWLYDIHLLAESLSPGQWQWLSTAAHEKQLASVCLDGLEQSSHYFDTEIQREIKRSLATGSEKETFTPETEGSRWQSELSSFRNLPGWNERLRLLREHLFPPSYYMLQKYKTSNRLLLPWLYLKRVAQGVTKFR